MGKMKLIYEMVQNGTSQGFINAYRKAKLTNAIGFTYDFIFYDIIRAKAFVLVIKKAEQDYNKHIDRIAELDQAAIEL